MAAAKTQVTVTLFVTKGCPHCQVGREYLAEQGVAFVERDVLGPDCALEDMLYIFGRSEVPALFAGYEGAVGFDAVRWREVLDHARTIEERGDPYGLAPVFGADPTSL